MKIKIDLKFKASSEKLAINVIQALLPDITDTSKYFERSELILSNQREIIQLQIKANDLIAAKSSINTTLKWIENSIRFR